MLEETVETLNLNYHKISRIDMTVEYEDLHDLISFQGFSYSRYYEHEREILKPRMEEKGFTEVKFFMGERDSFGPLTRIVKCVDKEGNSRKFIYG